MKQYNNFLSLALLLYILFISCNVKSDEHIKKNKFFVINGNSQSNVGFDSLEEILGYYDALRDSGDVIVIKYDTSAKKYYIVKEYNLLNKNK